MPKTHEELEKEVAFWKKSWEEETSEITTYKQEILACNEEIDRLRTMIADWQKTAEEKDRVIKDQSYCVDSQTKRNTDLQEEIAKLQDTINDMDLQITGLKNVNSGLNNKLDARDEQISTLNKRLAKITLLLDIMKEATNI